METEGSLPRLQEPATSSYSEPDQSCPHRPSCSMKMHFNNISHLRLRIASSLLSGFLTKKSHYARPLPHHSHTAFLLVRRAAVTKNIQFRCYGGGGSLLPIKNVRNFPKIYLKDLERSIRHPSEVSRFLLHTTELYH